jgi:hypothetical protein
MSDLIRNKRPGHCPYAFWKGVINCAVESIAAKDIVEDRDSCVLEFHLMLQYLRRVGFSYINKAFLRTLNLSSPPFSLLCYIDTLYSDLAADFLVLQYST